MAGHVFGQGGLTMNNTTWKLRGIKEDSTTITETTTDTGSDYTSIELGVVGTSKMIKVAQYSSFNNRSRVVTLLDGSGNSTFPGVINGLCTSSYWADLAEKYLSDAPYEKGTLICFGGDKEITVATDHVNGVISDQPGFVLNSDSEGLPVALAGKTRIKVIGRVNKFDGIVLDQEHPGCGKVDNSGIPVIARALESSDESDQKLVMCVTQFTL